MRVWIKALYVCTAVEWEMRDLMHFRVPIAEEIFLHSSLLHVVIWWSLTRPYTENCYLLLSCMSSVSARKKWKEETNIYFSFVSFLYLTSLSTQQDCVLPVVFRRDVEFCVKNREKRRKALWVMASLRLVDWSSGYFSVMETNSTVGGGGGGELLPCMGDISMCNPKGNCSSAVLVLNCIWVSILAILLLNKVWFYHSPSLESGLFLGRSYLLFHHYQ